jgi:phage terminase large subunit-like protein
MHQVLLEHGWQVVRCDRARAAVVAQARNAVSVMDPHVAKALAYCHDVVSGKVPACKWVRLACQRQLDDLKRAEGGWEYRFDEGRAGRVCRFLEQLPHVKGPKAGELFRLEPWQCFVVTTAWGWVLRDTGARRFRRAYIEVPRGNGKSFLSSGIALYGLGADDEQGAEVYSGATTREQAKITYGDAEKMLKKRPALANKLGLRVTAHAISQPASGSVFKALSREAGNQDGQNIHVAVVDELHAHRTREMWDVLVTGAAKRPQSMIWTITTAGTDTSGICYEVRESVTKMLDGAKGAELDGLFGVIYTLDNVGEKDGDDWRDPACWEKANPNWHASIDHKSYALAAREAMQSASKENNFLTKHLNVWCNADVSWMDMGAWDRCKDEALSEEDFAGKPCTMGIDLASKTDICATAKVFHRDVPAKNHDGTPKMKKDEEGRPTDEQALERHFYLFVNSFLPEAAVEAARNASYEGWVKEGWVKTTPGDVLDFDVVAESVLDDRDRHVLGDVAFDPAQATQFCNNLQKEAVQMVEVRPTVLNFSEPMKEMEALVLSRRLHHNGNPAMRWMVSNVVCHRDAKDNIYPRKQRPENKIDGVIAALMALNRALLVPEDAGSVYEERGIRTL